MRISKEMLYSCPVTWFRNDLSMINQHENQLSLLFWYLISFVFSEHEFEISSLPFVRSGC